MASRRWPFPDDALVLREPLSVPTGNHRSVEEGERRPETRRDLISVVKIAAKASLEMTTE